jgi:uncharacterized protein
MDVFTQASHDEAGFRQGPWIMRQRWHNLLFAHWPVPIDQLRRAVPPELRIDTYEGEAWLGLVVFRLSGVGLRGLPTVKAVASFPEVNVRTYVTQGDRPGVYFLSLDADNPLAVAIARPWFALNYYNADIGFSSKGGTVTFKCRRIQRRVPEARLQVSYKPTEAYVAANRLEAWLTERYSYYTVRGGHVHRCDIRHPEWPLQRARASFDENSMAESHGITLPDTAPLLHYCRYMEAHIWPLRLVERRACRAQMLLRSLAARATS